MIQQSAQGGRQNILRAVITADRVAVGWNIMLFLEMNSPDIFSKSGNFGTSGFNHLHRRDTQQIIRTAIHFGLLHTIFSASPSRIYNLFYDSCG